MGNFSNSSELDIKMNSMKAKILSLVLLLSLSAALMA